MTIEERVIADIGDIEAVVFQCSKCAARVTRDPKNPGTIPYQCGQCNTTWLPERSNEEHVTNRLLLDIASYRRGVSDGFIVRLEFDAKKLRG